MEMQTTAVPVSIPAYFVNITSGSLLTSAQANASRRSTLITVLAQSSTHGPIQGTNVDAGAGGESDDDDDLFGEHYFHICIYIWACVVVSSLIALSVKWGCCGRSLTRWEVKRIPLKRFQKTEGDDCQDKCPICHEEFNEGRLIRQLPCNHCYHSYCVDRWLVKMSNRCPLCKQRVSINLFCPWNKQHRKKEIHGHLGADAEASVDESPPLPPLSTLTPSNWYGEDIMSGPSKFIIMRPGRPTRVIDIREQNKKAKAEHDAKVMAIREFQAKALADAKIHRVDSFHELQIPPGADNSNMTSENLMQTCESEELDDTLCPSTQISSMCSSRSCSISSDQPLLLETRYNASGEQEIVIVSETQHPALSLKRCAHIERESLSDDRPLSDDSVSIAESVVDPVERDGPVEATITLSSGSSSVVSCNFKSPSSSFLLVHNPSIPDVSHHSASLHSSPTSHKTNVDPLTSMTPNKHDSWPGNVTEGSESAEFETCFNVDGCNNQRCVELNIS